jgi:hypothetical protein
LENVCEENLGKLLQSDSNEKRISTRVMQIPFILFKNNQKLKRKKSRNGNKMKELLNASITA